MYHYAQKAHRCLEGQIRLDLLSVVVQHGTANASSYPKNLLEMDSINNISLLDSIDNNG
jgi:hypothetical protein